MITSIKGNKYKIMLCKMIPTVKINYIEIILSYSLNLIKM